MIHVLFVCLGNICRSPMAEAVFRHLVRQEGLEDRIVVDSAGTGDWHEGEPPHRGTRKVLDRHGIDYSGIRARQIRPEDLERFQYIVCMDTSNLNNVNRMKKEGNLSNVLRLMELVPHSKTLDVPDPYYTGNFEEVYELVFEGCRELLQFIKTREGLSGSGTK